MRPKLKTKLKHTRPTEARLRKRSRFTGVVWDRKNRGSRWGKWKARIMVDGRIHVLGYFHDEVEAARAYDRAVVAFHQDELKMNFPAGARAEEAAP